ncbi:MAG: hypothetical protein IKI58_08875 [Oscillospiraceae bacterium]|nr:hypothetical protein [Oscillospiraceae bacterium]
MQTAALCFIDSTDLYVYGILAVFMFVIIVVYVLIERVFDGAARAFKKASSAPDCVPNSPQPQRLADRFYGIWIPPALPPVRQYAPQPVRQPIVPQIPAVSASSGNAAVPQRRFCKYCGAPVKGSGIFCAKCGKRI